MTPDLIRRAIQTRQTCTCCGVEKPVSEFYARANRRPARKCKKCELERAKGYAAENKEKVSAYKAAWGLENKERLNAEAAQRYRDDPERAIERAAKWAKENAEKVMGYKKAWKMANPESVRESSFLRNRRTKRASPAWRNKKAMVAIYRKARALTESTGVEHHVDHIVPIQSDLVCGLHCEQNMQILTAAENISKFNRYWPDMPGETDA